ncbi:hypothetical protein [Kitasatospora acidiphila]|uniref:hypothetical protein n=1 Tax=Kitasatospora acidiphila TaxID=2567942 RepID=UPI003C781D1D
MRLPRPLLCLPLIAALAACGSSGQKAASPTVSTSAAASPAVSATPVASSSASPQGWQGWAGLSAGDLLSDAVTATDKIQTLKVDAINPADKGDVEHLDVDQLAGNCAGTMAVEGAPYLSFVIKAGQNWERLEAGYPSTPATDRLKGHYFKTPNGSPGLKDMLRTCQLDPMISKLIDGRGTMTKGDTISADGHQAVWITDTSADGSTSTILVSVDSGPYVLQEKKGTKTLTLSAFNSPVTITQPPADQVVDAPGAGQLPGI